MEIMGGKIRYGDLNNSEDLRILLNSLEIVKNKGKERWNPVDIINAIYTGTTAFLIGDNNKYCLTFYTKCEYGINIFWAWTVYGDGSNMGDKYMDDIKDLARSLNCTEMRWASKRKGYAKTISKVQGEVHQVEYKIQL
jgi:hypothetical protein